MRTAQLFSSVAFGVFLSIGAAGAQTASTDQSAATSSGAQTSEPKTVRRIGDKDWPDAKNTKTVAQKPAEKPSPGKQTSTVKTDPLSLDGKASVPADAAPVSAAAPNTETTGQTPPASPAPAAATTKPTPAAELTAAKSGASAAAKPPAKVQPDGAASIRLGTDAAGRVALNAEQERQIGAAIRAHHVEPLAQVDFDVKVGTAVPAAVRLGAVSNEVVEVLPQFRGYSYFATREQIVIVEPSTKKIVALLPVRVTATAARSDATKHRAALPSRRENRQAKREQTRSTVTRRPPYPGPVNIERDITVGAGGEEIVVERITPRFLRRTSEPTAPNYYRTRTYRTLEPDDRSAVIIQRGPRRFFGGDDD
ncbi:MAG: DUF1236 domain-containing protein [Pseudolabrys sp.]